MGWVSTLIIASAHCHSVHATVLSLKSRACSLLTLFVKQFSSLLDFSCSAGKGSCCGSTTLHTGIQSGRFGKVLEFLEKDSSATDMYFSMVLCLSLDL